MGWMPTKSQIVAEFIDKVLSQGEIDATGDYFWEDVVELEPFPGQGPGLEGLKDLLRMLRNAFPDMYWMVQEQMEDGDKVMTRFIWTGTHQGDFMGVPPSGNHASVWGMVIDRFEGDKIKDTRIIMDVMGLMMQIGAIPAP